MDQPTEREELRSAWRALAGTVANAEGWSTIPLALTGARRLRAGRHFPGNEEALLVGFASAQMPQALQLPQGQGFVVSKVDLGDEDDGGLWLALSRRTEGSLDMFTMMSLDIIEILNLGSAIAEEQMFQRFIARIRAWQDFMRRGTDATLSAEAEIGLFGELVFLRSMLEVGLSLEATVDSWVGPIDGIQDFFLGGGAVEVKTTIATMGFAATIGSLDQMDDSSRQPLFLAAVRICLNQTGMSLRTIIEDTRMLLRADSAAFHNFNLKLIHAGYFDSVAEHYKRTFCHVSTRILLVAEGFPRLTRGRVPPMIIRASYDLDIDGVGGDSIDIGMALDQLGVI